MINSVVPMTKFEIFDQSQAPTIPKSVPKIPLFLTAFSSDKGQEELQIVDINNFYKDYVCGTDLSFARHGQPLLQAANIVEAGGKLLCKRVVAKDSTLANVLILGSVKKIEEQKKDNDGNLLYTDAAGKETKVADGNTPIMLTKCKYKFMKESIPAIKTKYDILDLIETKYTKAEDEEIFPLFYVTDNGRGVSNKKFRISPNYRKSRKYNYIEYNLEVIEGVDILENITFSGNPSVIEAKKNKSIDSMIDLYSNQIKCKLITSYFYKFIDKISEISGLKSDYLLSQDILFGKTKKQLSIPEIELDLASDDAVNLSYSFGIQLENGSNGSFGNAPFGTKDYEDALLEFFNGTYTSDIYDLDKYKIDLIADANYPTSVKRQIEALITFREDAFYLRDGGLKATNIDEIEAIEMDCTKNCYCGSYYLSYDILDPISKRPITVTMTYELAALCVEHFKNGRSRPLCGELYDIVLSEAIPGTESFLPKVTPLVNEKQELCDLRVNYASYYGDKLVLETEYTSQDLDTDLSAINNVVATQEIVKAVRTRCPKIRYSFIDGKDLDKYKEDVSSVLNKYSNNFKKLELRYIEDDTMKENKIFYAAILVVYKDFVQQEYFKLYALNEIVDE